MLSLAIGGICHQVLPVAQTLAASDRTIGVPKQPRPPYILEWLSEATVIVDLCTDQTMSTPGQISLTEKRNPLHT